MTSYEDIDINNKKVKRIVNAGFKEFASYGLSKASLNKILKESGISKGVFYYYFEDKDNLFNYLSYFAYDFTFKSYSKKIALDDDDIIKRICDISKIKLDIIIDHPYMLNFFEKFRDHIMNNIDNKYIENWKVDFYSKNISYKQLCDQSKSKELVNIAKWTYKGIFMNHINTKSKIEKEDIEELKKECDIYYKILSDNFYD